MCTIFIYYQKLTHGMWQVSLVVKYTIRPASANSVEFLRVRPGISRIYFDNVTLTLHDVTLTLFAIWTVLSSNLLHANDNVLTSLCSCSHKYLSYCETIDFHTANHK